MKKAIKTVLDTVLIAGYVVGLVGFMPMLLVYSWAKESWSV